MHKILFFDVNNGLSRRAWARNPEALTAIKRQMKSTPELSIHLPNLVDKAILEAIFNEVQ